MKSRDYVAAVLIVIPFIVYLDIPSYNTVAPALGGLSFFYWWQTLWLAISALFFFIAAVLIGRRS